MSNIVSFFFSSPEVLQHLQILLICTSRFSLQDVISILQELLSVKAAIVLPLCHFSVYKPKGPGLRTVRLDSSRETCNTAHSPRLIQEQRKTGHLRGDNRSRFRPIIRKKVSKSETKYWTTTPHKNRHEGNVGIM